MQVTKDYNENEVVLSVEGRIDSGSVGLLQSEILNAFSDSNMLVLDFGDVEYISSAGLRALLIGQKTAMSKKGYMKVLHVNEEVRNVFTITGFMDVLQIVD
ncbi:MAG: STAS domain-containing protein [Clostridia bacterium]|nr:STAS domain-containing protein [Clostridia bacterium]